MVGTLLSKDPPSIGSVNVMLLIAIVLLVPVSLFLKLGIECLVDQSASIINNLIL
jgi:hypothetical protein